MVGPEKLVDFKHKILKKSRLIHLIPHFNYCTISELIFADFANRVTDLPNEATWGAVGLFTVSAKVQTRFSPGIGPQQIREKKIPKTMQIYITDSEAVIHTNFSLEYFASLHIVR